MIIKNLYFNTLVNNNNQDKNSLPTIKLKINEKKFIYKIRPYGIKLKEASFIISNTIVGYFIIADCPNDSEERISVITTNIDNIEQLKQLIIKINLNNDYDSQILLQLEEYN